MSSRSQLWQFKTVFTVYRWVKKDEYNVFGNMLRNKDKSLVFKCLFVFKEAHNKTNPRFDYHFVIEP